MASAIRASGWADRSVSAFLIAFCLSAGGVGAQPSSPAARPPSALDAPLVAHIDALARVEAQAERLSGVMLVARGDRVVFQQAYGFASWELQTPVTPTTRFGIGSITKVMTETVVDALVREGRLDLSAPVSRYLGSFPTGPKGGVVTVRHLVDHRSGIPHRVTMQMEETLPLHPSDIVERVRARGLLFEPGLQELYSSAGFSCLARVIELIERQPFGAVLRDRIFRPAAMATASDETGQQLMPLRALPYRLGTSAGSLAVASASYKHLGFLTGAGSVYATVDDLLRFVRASRNGVFGPAAKERVVEKDGQPWRSWYGRTDGYEASVDVLPSADVTFVFVSNLRSAANWQLRERVKDLLLGREPGALPRPPTPLGAPFEPFDSVVGSYGDPADPIVIALVDGHLFRDDSEIYPIAEGRYYLPASGTVMRFRRTGDGTVDALLTVRVGSQNVGTLS